ncbi:MAG TPA: bifunctional 5,10-methylenetetrahydrofolate dehydrogenase/5,10-methenyltetrahydrofolate cyclohydrolase [Pyrinomonadaceae bacterium]|nr:bifunctional 5,10-methylenetetrahydrofolate dehydrogenase/5,10-methenyltetrahydrofolate cyclohydrolase [Pyrinomonadaceae bacterium]
MTAENTTTGPRARLFDAESLARRIKDEVKTTVDLLVKDLGLRPGLAAIRVGDDPASAVYVRNKIRACEEVGIRSEHHALPGSTSTSQLLDLIASLNADREIDGVLAQLPMPAEVDETAIIEAIDPMKDVDGFHPMNAGKLAMGRPEFIPCTPSGIIELLADNRIELRGANACVVGRSQIVGRPMAQLLLREDATVTICHSRTRDLAAVTRTADVLVVAIGKPGFIGRDHIKPGAVVIDVGMNQVSDRDEVRALFGADAGKRLDAVAKRGYTLVGDVNPAEALEVAGMLTPVPGGVGLLTVAMLMKNTLRAANLRRA